MSILLSAPSAVLSFTILHLLNKLENLQYLSPLHLPSVAFPYDPALSIVFLRSLDRVKWDAEPGTGPLAGLSGGGNGHGVAAVGVEEGMASAHRELLEKCRGL
jgi:hypothetical protein